MYNNTTIRQIENGITEVVLHNTLIVEFTNDAVVLNTGGYHTTTTKRRMNQISEDFNLGYRVFQKDYDWYVSRVDYPPVRFHDGIELVRDDPKR